ncbi:MAG: hypothetical protein IKM07_05210 [Clostridia bacterium]|nr:hypothetical protein [Clostridia bacterium]
MRRVFCLLPCLFLLCSCRTASVSEQIAPFYQSANIITARLAVTVDSGTQVCDFIMDWSYDGAVSTLSVVEPASLTGVVLRADPDARKLLYDEAVLVLPAADGLFLSPLEMLASTFACWREGYYESSAAENSRDASSITLTWRQTAGEYDSAELSTVFDAQTLLPLSCEYILGGVRRMTARFLTVAVS